MNRLLAEIDRLRDGIKQGLKLYEAIPPLPFKAMSTFG